MANPFKKIITNANKTPKEKDANETSSTDSKKCKNCGAVRPKDTNLTTCDYCGFKFMTIDDEIKIDK